MPEDFCSADPITIVSQATLRSSRLAFGVYRPQ
jgi:hypothetical protein